MKSLPTVVLLLVVVLAQAEGLKIRCFARFNLVSGQCEEELGLVEEDDCCQNPKYSFIDAAGDCQFCGPAVWTAWSPWSECSDLCGSGVVKRTRKCHGLSECSVDQTALEMKPCDSDSCCPAAEWEDWGAWSPCSRSCGSHQGHRERKRVCSHPTPGCEKTCVGPNAQTETCVETQPCPVHGGWAKWSDWTPCSDECILGPFHDDGLGVYPTRRRYRTCSSPTPSLFTTPAGNDCDGNVEEVQNCSELPNCPVDGGWGGWGPFGACSSSCGEGLMMSIRLCDNPAPQYGGQNCVGTSTQSAVCRNTCPVHGVWSGWAAWTECSTTCHSSLDSIRSRWRSCSNPAPSSNPNGNNCQGDFRENKKCDELPNCPVDGAWGPWGPYNGCSVTCGVGVRRSVRTCNSPAPKYLGKQCPGSSSRTLHCTTNTHCPVDGVWSEWSDWTACKGSRGPITCRTIRGSQARNRSCLQKDFGGALCPIGALSERRGCYDINKCHSIPPLGWSDWSEWGVCYGNNKMISYREKICEADLSEYNSFDHFTGEPMAFYGKPLPKCAPLPIAERRQIKNCIIPQ
ncbi:unnamed protein product [Lota lota]